MNIAHAERLQLGNYGLGGHYDPHFDFFGDGHNVFESDVVKERIATFMVYLGDVDAGGATVFVHKNISIHPKKGDAVFWYNLHKDGIGHNQTLHGGCPVLIGSKWMLNVWIRAEGQELIRPCALHPDFKE